MALHANVVIVSGIRRYEGTAAALAASTFEGIPAGSTFLETDTGVIYVLDKALALQPKYEQVKIAAGTAIVGKVGIDQTTDGTTNKVQARNATADNFQVNANLQVGDADNAVGNPAFVQLTGSNAPLGGQKNVTTAGTRVALTSGSQAYKKITIVAKTTNTGLIYIGDVTVDSTHGLILPAGGCSPDLEFVNTNAIYIDSSVNGEGVSWVGVI